MKVFGKLPLFNLAKLWKFHGAKRVGFIFTMIATTIGIISGSLNLLTIFDPQPEERSGFSSLDSAALSLQARNIPAAERGWWFAAERNDAQAAEALRTLQVPLSDDFACNKVTSNLDHLKFLQEHTGVFSRLRCDDRSPADVVALRLIGFHYTRDPWNMRVRNQITTAHIRTLRMNQLRQALFDLSTLSIEFNPEKSRYNIGTQADVYERNLAKMRFYLDIGHDAPMFLEFVKEIGALADELSSEFSTEEGLKKALYEICYPISKVESPRPTPVFQNWTRKPLPTFSKCSKLSFEERHSCTPFYTRGDFEKRLEHCRRYPNAFPEGSCMSSIYIDFKDREDKCRSQALDEAVGLFSITEYSEILQIVKRDIWG